MRTYKAMAELIASKLTREELIELENLLDMDSDDAFFWAIAMEVQKVAPELFADPNEVQNHIDAFTAQEADTKPEKRTLSGSAAINSDDVREELAKKGNKE